MIWHYIVVNLITPNLKIVSINPEARNSLAFQGFPRWAVLKNTSGCCFVVFRGSETMLDWTENSRLVAERGLCLGLRAQGLGV